MQCEDVEMLIGLLRGERTGAMTYTEAADMVAALLDRAERAEAERDAASHNAVKLNEAFIQMEAERDAVFTAGQRDMQERAIQIAQEKHDLAVKWASHHLKEFDGKTDSLLIANEIRALPIKDRPDGD